MFNAPNPGRERRREWEDRSREEKREKKGGVIRQVMSSGDTVMLCSPSAMGELVKSALGERPETGADGNWIRWDYKWGGRPGLWCHTHHKWCFIWFSEECLVGSVFWGHCPSHAIVHLSLNLRLMTKSETNFRSCPRCEHDTHEYVRKTDFQSTCSYFHVAFSLKDFNTEI